MSDFTGALTMDDKEQQHLMAALRQPLFIQTPLQAMLEHVLQKMQKHSQIISDAWDKIHMVEQQQHGFVDLLGRLQLMETRVEAATSCRTSPFGQADIMLRLEAVEKLAAKTDQHMQAVELQAMQDVQPRLHSIEKQLHGVSNLSGRLMALDEVAFELGVTILDVTAQGGSTAPAGMSHAKLIQQSAEQPGTGAPTPAAVLQAAETQAAAHQAMSPQSAGWPNCPPDAEPSQGQPMPRRSGGGASRSRADSDMHTMQAHISDNSSSGGAAYTRQDDAAGVADSDSIAHVRAHADASTSNGDTVDTVQRSSHVSTGGSTVPGERTAAKFQALQDQIDVLRRGGKAMAALIDELRSGLAKAKGAVVASEARAAAGTAAAVEIMADVVGTKFMEQVTELRQEVMNKPPEVSFADFSQVQSAVAGAHAAASTAAATSKQLHDKELPSVRRAVEELQRRLGRALGVRDADKALSDAVTELKGDIAAVRAKVDEAGAALLASEGVATAAEVQELLQLMRTKASKEDLKSVMGRAVELALDSYRAASMDSSGAGATRFKCLTCNRDVVDAPLRLSPPRSAVAADEFKATGNGSNAGPMGPGLNAAHLRRLAEERMFGDRGVLHSSGLLDTGERPSTASPGRLHTITAELALDPDYSPRHSISGNRTARLVSASSHSPGSPGGTARGSRPGTASGGSEGRGGMLHKGRPPTAKSGSQRTAVFL